MNGDTGRVDPPQPKESAGEFHMNSVWFDHAEPAATTVQHRQIVLWECFTGVRRG